MGANHKSGRSGAVPRIQQFDFSIGRGGQRGLQDAKRTASISLTTTTKSSTTTKSFGTRSRAGSRNGRVQFGGWEHQATLQWSIIVSLLTSSVGCAIRVVQIVFLVYF